MVNLTNIVVLDKRTNENPSLDHGDFVVCCNCGKTMLADIGTENCPICGKETLEWADDEDEEVSEDFFSNNKKYMLAKGGVVI